MLEREVSIPPERPFILVTGGTGFLGSHVVQQLLEGGYRVRCTARPLKSRILETAYLGLVRTGQLEVVEVGDLATESLGRALTISVQRYLGHPHLFSIGGCLNTNADAGITAVIHTAFPAPGSMEGTELLLNATTSTTSLLRQAYEHGIRKFVLTSSYLAAVGARVGQGQGQDHGGVWSEYTFSDRDWTQASYHSVFNGSDDPAWAYAAAKTLTETAAWDFANARPDFDLATVLPTLLLGPFASGHAILSTNDLSTNVLLHSMLKSGVPPHPVWPYFVDVRDAARAHVKALEAPSLSRYASVSPNPSNESGSATRGLSPRSGSANLTIPLASSNPSLVDLGSTLEKLEISYQTTSGSPTLQYLNTDVPVDMPYSDSLLPPSLSPSVPPTIARQTHAPRKRLIACGASFTWPDAITHLRTARPDLSSSLPDERVCLPMPTKVAKLEGTWSGAGWAHIMELQLEDAADDLPEGTGDSKTEDDPRAVWDGLAIKWRDWRETVEDAVEGLERVAGGLEESGWEDLFGSEEDDDIDYDDQHEEVN